MKQNPFTIILFSVILSLSVLLSACQGNQPVSSSGPVQGTDTVVVAIGTSPNPLIRSTTTGLETNRKGCFIVNDSMETTRDGVYAGGDAVTGAATIILAMGAGKKAAAAIHEKLSGIEKQR